MAQIARLNEADRLMEAFNRVQDQVDTAIADQRELSANLHHEVRTPLAVIRSDAEIMLLDNTCRPEDVRPRLERIARSVTDIEQSLQSTYHLAHARFADESPVNLHLCVDDIFESLGLEADKAGMALVNAVEPTHQEVVNQPALMTVMRNIVRNAALHAAPAKLIVDSVARGLRFTDNGPGIAASDLPYVFDRYFSSRRSDQAGSVQRMDASADVSEPGLGLAIAKRVCVIQSWRLEVESPVRDGKGTRFILSFRQEG